MDTTDFDQQHTVSVYHCNFVSLLMAEEELGMMYEKIKSEIDFERFRDDFDVECDSFSPVM